MGYSDGTRDHYDEKENKKPNALHGYRVQGGTYNEDGRRRDGGTRNINYVYKPEKGTEYYGKKSKAGTDTAGRYSDREPQGRQARDISYNKPQSRQVRDTNYKSPRKTAKASVQRHEVPKRRLSRREMENMRMRVMRNRFILLVVIIAIVVVLVVSISSGGEKDKTSEKTTQTAEAETMVTAESSEIPAEYVQPSITRDTVEVSSELPAVSQNSNYSIKVNVACNTVTVYNKEADGSETPVKAMVCSTARQGYETTQGTFKLGEWYDWCYMADGTWGQYAFRIIDDNTNSLMFHSVPYVEQAKNTLECEEFNKLGEVSSMGCVRLAIWDARWICANCGYGTEVVIYSDASTPGPLGKPVALFIPEDVEQIKNWDPTDPDPSNPWHDYNLTVQIPNSITVAAGTSSIDWTKSVTATDTYGINLAKYVKDDGQYDLKTAGTYKTKLTLDIGVIHVSKDVYVVVN